MDYLKEFLNLEEYETYKDGEDFALPNVSLINEPYSVKYTPYTPPNYFRITNLENIDGDIALDAVWSSSYPEEEFFPITIEYCINGDGVWTSITDNKLIVIPIPAKGYVELRGDNISMCNYNDDYNATLYWNLSVEYNHNLSGDIMSICGFSDILEDFHFYRFFEQNTTLIDASNLILSASTLKQHCYDSMFGGCTNLVNAPKLPATKLANSCYCSMFYHCTSLTTAPELPATELVEYCYREMFTGCSSLNYIKALFLTTPGFLYTNIWVHSVAATGTFVKNLNATWDVTGNNGVPTGWDVEAMADEYFTTIAREDGTISFNIWKSMGTECITSISYSTDDGETWDTINNEDNKTEHLVIDVDVNEGDKVLWKGDAIQFGCWYTNDNEEIDDVVGSFFSSDCEFDAQGNIMSLLYGDSFKGETTFEDYYAFAHLFHDYNGEKACKVVNTKNLSLPATTLWEGCYQDMFEDCTNLISIPELPATTLANHCYFRMFYGCTSLTIAPELPATTLANHCYLAMFMNCTNLTKAPKLPATTLVGSCYDYMFRGCTSLTIAPKLPATILVDNCYYGMFSNCTSLTTAPELPATTLAQQCYSNMFAGCTSLTTAPELPAITLAQRCYESMFWGCTSLINAPLLLANELKYACYLEMFRECTSLNSITCLATDISANLCTTNWVDNVATTGTFTKHPSMNNWTTGDAGIPNGWTVQTATE